MKVLLVLAIIAIVIFSSSTAFKVKLLSAKKCMKWIAPIVVSSQFLSPALGDSEVVLNGVINLSPNTQVPPTSEKALYVTVTPDLGVVNSQILLRKFPAVMTKRIKGDDIKYFPYKFKISEKEDGTEDVNLQHEKWATGKLPLTISVRYDSDGSAATRDSTDLVGKTEIGLNNDGKFEVAEVSLTDRGLGGKFVTTKKQK